MSDNLANNPFFGLFDSANDANKFSQQNDSNEDSSAKENSISDDYEEEKETTSELNLPDDINNLIQDIFHITASKNATSKPLVYVEDTAATLETPGILDMNSLEQALFERLLLEEPGNFVVAPTSLGNAAIHHHVIEKEVLTYLYDCHKQLINLQRFKKYKALVTMDELVIRNFVTALISPEIYGNQQLHIQFINIFNNDDHLQRPLVSLVNAIVNVTVQDSGTEGAIAVLSKAFYPVLDEIKERFENSTLMTMNRNLMNLVGVFSSIPALAEILVHHSTPEAKEDGAAYGDTLFGAILSTSCLPRSGIRYKPAEQFQFDRSMEDSFWIGLKANSDFMHNVFFNLFKNDKKTKDMMLSWIGCCLHANASRGKLSNTHEMEMSVLAALTSVSDGFMMNLCGVLIRLCKPFINKNEKLMKIDPTYCAVEDQREGVHLKGMSKETCLITLSSDSGISERPTARSYNFLSDIFFMTHKALDLGFRVVFDKWMQINQELSRIQQQLETTQARLPETAQTLRQMLESKMQRSLAMRCTLLEENNLRLLAEVCVATSEWLIQVAIQPPFTGEPETYAPINSRELFFPLPEYVPPTLSCVPEMLFENLACYMSMVRRFAPIFLDDRGTSFLEPLLSQVLVFMGNKTRMRNPHLRARLAECMESLLPHQERDEQIPGRFLPPSVHKEQLFKLHPHRAQIVRSLLDVFVGIEVTGESVAFEQKFNYRRPMYIAMDYLWGMEEQRAVFKELAREAQENINAVTPPLFLRFINLLLNDAVFLLDEALANMALLRTMHTARDNGEWDNLPRAERQQNEGQLMHIGMLARFDNILGKETIHTLQYITTEVTSIFCDPSLVNRIAAMLNYFLTHLVGPEKKKFKVKDRQEYEFKPADLVMDICRIYVNLGKCDEFCLAVSQDGRSYSPSLFQQAEHVLVRIGGGMLITDFMQVASRVAERALEQTAEEEALAEAPEEFYDPILSTLMVDPVILPSSKTTCDRSTIASHLLNDQTDPFTKAPLTMDQVIPDVELKERIEAWKTERRSQRASASTSQERTTVPTEEREGTNH
ncbi:ubiquitin conjugation factor E4 A [Thrips palmi]|uniref:Ubiquitin conjugation factor E4 A n=1 Tax=Thrips palmi TaxID=161013 RepID=A0A6P8Z478_THRPL|nr:ubiquitin conjugation factor E4 A [Thrips palmi]